MCLDNNKMKWKFLWNTLVPSSALRPPPVPQLQNPAADTLLGKGAESNGGLPFAATSQADPLQEPD